MRQSDRARWFDAHSYDPSWVGRAALAAQFIEPGSKILDLGCGEMQLASVLPADCSYSPADLHPRHAGVIQIDLNRGEFPEGHYDYVVLLGVLEYLHDPAGVLRRAREHADNLICSYQIVKKRDLKMKQLRLRGGYFNDFDDNSLACLLADNGWKVSQAKTHLESDRVRTDVFLSRGISLPKTSPKNALQACRP